MSSWVKNPAAGKFRFSFGDFPNSPQISSRITSGAKIWNFRMPLALPRSYSRTRLKNLINIIMKCLENNFGAPKMLFCKKSHIFDWEISKSLSEYILSILICDGISKTESILRVSIQLENKMNTKNQSRSVFINSLGLKTLSHQFGLIVSIDSNWINWIRWTPSLVENK